MVDFTAPSGYTATLQNAGSDDTKDSDADVLTGKNQSITLAAGEFGPMLDAGIYLLLRNISAFVWSDLNKNGKQDADEQGVGGIAAGTTPTGNNDG